MENVASLEHFNKQTHAGAFGKVFEGVLNDPDKNMADVQVAIKTIRSTGYIYSHGRLYVALRRAAPEGGSRACGRDISN